MKRIHFTAFEVIADGGDLEVACRDVHLSQRAA